MKKAINIQFFTEREAWNLFRIAAIGEAVGWTLLIAGILFKHYITPGNNDAVIVAGQLHGTLFLIYLGAVIALCGSFHWSFKQTILAGLVSVPPYGTLVFEQFLAHKRRQERLKSHRQIVVRAIIPHRKMLLAVQFKENAFWCLPGGPIDQGEQAKQALERIILDQTGILPSVTDLLYIFEYKHSSTERIELFFNVLNGQDYEDINLGDTKRGNVEIDEIAFIEPQTTELLPKFLQAKQTLTPKHTNRSIEIIQG